MAILCQPFGLYLDCIGIFILFIRVIDAGHRDAPLSKGGEGVVFFFSNDRVIYNPLNRSTELTTKSPFSKGD